MAERSSEGCGTDGFGSAVRNRGAATGGEPAPDEFDAAVVGGGPAGASAAVFAARNGLDVVVFDRGASSLGHCAVLENYPGFPGGIEIETFQGLLRDHVEAAGAELREDLVERVDPAADSLDRDGGATDSLDRDGSATDSLDRDDGARFAVEPQDGDAIRVDRVVAATRYDADYLRPLDDPAMFETVEHRGESRERLDRSYPAEDGQTPIDGLYVASPTDAADRQAVLAAGRGARVGLTVVEDVRRERGYPEAVVRYRDWRRSEADRDAEWADRDRWREWFEDRLPDEHDLGEDELADLREREVDRLLDTYRSDAEVERSADRGQRRLLERLDDDLVLERAREVEAERARAVVDGPPRSADETVTWDSRSEATPAPRDLGQSTAALDGSGEVSD